MKKLICALIMVLLFTTSCNLLDKDEAQEYIPYGETVDIIGEVQKTGEVLYKGLCELKIAEENLGLIEICAFIEYNEENDEIDTCEIVIEPTAFNREKSELSFEVKRNKVVVLVKASAEKGEELPNDEKAESYWEGYFSIEILIDSFEENKAKITVI